MKQANQKLKAYLILQYLLENSDENHTISQEDIIAYLMENFGISAERRSIYKDIADINKTLYALNNNLTIQEAEEEIESEFDDDSWKTIVYDGSKKGYFAKRHYNINDIQAILACIYSAKFLTANRAGVCANIVLDSLVSRYQAEKIKHEALLTDRGRTLNKNVFDNIAIITKAMSIKTGKEKHTPKKISFKYVANQIKGGQAERRNGERYIVSPLQLLINDGNYYLLAYDDVKQDVWTFRVDRMKNVLETNLELEHQEALARFDISKYTKQNFGMYSGKKEHVTLKFINPLYDTVVDKLGSDLYYRIVDEKHFVVQVEVAITDQFFGWLCGFGRRVQLLEPPPIREKFKEYLGKIKDMY